MGVPEKALRPCGASARAEYMTADTEIFHASLGQNREIQQCLYVREMRGFPSDPIVLSGRGDGRCLSG
jgi:hypothetical protein|eukprot:724572-Prymnesium_polylepis.1